MISLENTNTGANPFVIAESAVIAEYLCAHFEGGERLIPRKYHDGKDVKEGEVGAESEEYMRYRYFMHYAEGSLMPFLVMQLVMDRMSPPFPFKSQSFMLMRPEIKAAPVPFFLKFIPRIVASQVEKAFLTRNIFAHFDFLEDQLKTAPGGGPFFCGENLSVADILLSFPLIAASSRVPDQIQNYPLILGWIERVQNIEGYQKAVKKVEEVEGSFDVI